MAIDGVPIDMQDEILTRPALKDYAEIGSEPSSAAGTLTLDIENGNTFDVTLDEDVDTVVIEHPASTGRASAITLIIRQDGTGGRVLTWPGNLKWASGVPPVVTSAASAIDAYLLMTIDAGATWLGFVGGQDFS